MTGVRHPVGAENFLFVTTSRKALELTQPNLPNSVFPEAGREANYSPPHSLEVKNAWSYTFILHTSAWHGAYLSTALKLISVGFRHNFVYTITTTTFTRLQVVTAVKIQVESFRVVTPCGVAVGYQHFERQFSEWSDDGGSMFLRNVGTLLQHCTASQPRRPRLAPCSQTLSIYILHLVRGTKFRLRNK
jgi:hypothetical protein